MRCPSCGAENPDAGPDHHCAICGILIGGTVAGRPPAAPGQPVPAPLAVPSLTSLSPPPDDELPAGSFRDSGLQGAAGADLTRRRRLPWLGIAGGLLVVGAALLPWVSMTLRPPTAFDIPLAVLVDLDATGTQPAIGWALAGIGGLGAVVSVWRWGRWARPILGALGLAIAVAFVVQFIRDVEQLRSARFVIDHLGAGVYLAFVGSLLLMGDRR